VLLPCCHYVACSACIDQMGAASDGGGRAARSRRAGAGDGGAGAKRCPVCRGCVHGRVVVHIGAAEAAAAAAGQRRQQEADAAARAGVGGRAAGEAGGGQ
jgi:hypothetical protein